MKPVGMYNQKAKNLIELCRQLVELHGGEVPHDREALESLPGVGRKTANIILNMVFGENDHCCRHAHLPCVESHRARARQGPA